MAQHRKAEQRRKRRQDGLRPLEIWLPAAMIEMIDELKRDDLLSREAIITAISEDAPFATPWWTMHR